MPPSAVLFHFLKFLWKPFLFKCNNLFWLINKDKRDDCFDFQFTSEFFKKILWGKWALRTVKTVFIWEKQGWFIFLFTHPPSLMIINPPLPLLPNSTTPKKDPSLCYFSNPSSPNRQTKTSLRDVVTKLQARLHITFIFISRPLHHLNFHIVSPSIHLSILIYV